MWNSCCNAIPQTSSLQTYGLLTFLTLNLWITGYVECCSNVFIGNLLKLNKLKLRLIEACFGIQQSVADQATDQWRVCLNACVKAKGKHFEDICYDVMFHNCQWFVMKLTLQFFYFTTFNQSRLFTARCTLVQSAVLPSHVVCLSVRLSVCL